MSYAIHIFMTGPFPAEPYRAFLADVTNLYGKYTLAESTPVYDTGPQIHECKIVSADRLSDESVGVWVAAKRFDKSLMWPFDYDWYISLETGTGRTPLGLAVQLASLLLAMQKFQWIVVLDRDADIDDNEPTEFRSPAAVAEHLKRVLGQHHENFQYWQRRGIINEAGYLLLPNV